MKILIIGQAPPLKTQSVPYDSTLLYTMLEWAGISKEKAQEMFEFEAITNEFPGLNKNNGHKAPSVRAMYHHWDSGLNKKVAAADKILILGEVARKFIFEKGRPLATLDKRAICLDHPSRRNYSRIMKNKESITETLKQFLT
jgi:uracil-DNA glycosylase